MVVTVIIAVAVTVIIVVVIIIVIVVAVIIIIVIAVIVVIITPAIVRRFSARAFATGKLVAISQTIAVARGCSLPWSQLADGRWRRWTWMRHTQRKA